MNKHISLNYFKNNQLKIKMHKLNNNKYNIYIIIFIL